LELVGFILPLLLSVIISDQRLKNMTVVRTVNDYATPRALRFALQSVDEEKSLSDTDETHTNEKKVIASYCTDKNSQCNEDTTEAVSQSDQQQEDIQLNDNWDWVLTNYDAGTTNPQSITQELHRLQVLKSYDIIGANREEAFDRLTTMATRVFGVQIALVSLVDLGRQWFMSEAGLGVKETPRNIAFCAHAIQGKNDVFVVPDAKDDPRFCGSPLVLGAPFIRFYAGSPLLSPEGYKLGTFCLIDSKPRPEGLSDTEKANLMDFAAMAMDAMVKRRQIKAQDDTAQLVACTAHDLLTPLMGVQLSLSLMQEEPEVLPDAQAEYLLNAVRSSDWLERICRTTMNTLRGKSSNEAAEEAQQCPLLNMNGEHTYHLATTGATLACNCGNKTRVARRGNGEDKASCFVDMASFLDSLNNTMESIPKKIPLFMTVDGSVPKRIVSDELKLFRSSLNLLSNAFSNTANGSVKFHIYASELGLVFECTDTGQDLNISEEDAKFLFKPCKGDGGFSENLGLYSVGYQVASLGGSYGYRARADEGKRGSVFWFSIPLILPDDVSIAQSISELSGLNLLDTLDSTTLHFPPVAKPAQEMSPTCFKQTSRRQPAACSHKRRMSSSEMRRIVRAAASSSASTKSESCCGLDEIANYKDIETYKACKAAKKQQHEQSVLASRSSTNTLNSDHSSSKSTGGLNSAGNSANDLLSSAIRASKNRLQKSGSIEKNSIQNKKFAFKTKSPSPPVANIIVVKNDNYEIATPLFSTSASTSARSVLLAAKKNDAARSKAGEPGGQSEAPLWNVATTSKNTSSAEAKPPGGALFQTEPVSTSHAPQASTSPKGTVAEERKCDSNLPSQSRPRKALVIEDTLIVRKTLTRALQKRGYQVSQAVDGLEGLGALKRTIFDITLCDFLMPNMDGLDCVQQYRQWEKQNRTFRQRIVGISAHVTHRDIDKGLEVGMDDFRPKPITIKTLQELDECLEMDLVREYLSTHSECFDGREENILCDDASGGGTTVAKFCLIATARSNVQSCETAKKMADLGWKVTFADDGSSALEQLKLRNWGAVIMDDDLPCLSGNKCVEEFREWERQNRVNRQDNLFLVCTDVVFTAETKMMAPAGFDGAMDSEMNWQQLQSMMANQSRKSVREGLSIVTR